jgi:thiol:disulfide interchange protein DsbD
MNKILFFLFALSLSFSATAQIQNPVKWEYKAKKIADKTYEVIFTAKIDKGWHLYAQETGEGPVPTSFSFARNPIVTTQGKTKEKGNLLKEFDNNFGSVLQFYADKVEFVQVVKLKANAKTSVNGEIEFMVCNDEKCLPPRKIPFSVKLS